MTDDDLTRCEQQMDLTGWLHGSLARPLINEVRRLRGAQPRLPEGKSVKDLLTGEGTTTAAAADSGPEFALPKEPTP